MRRPTILFSICALLALAAAACQPEEPTALDTQQSNNGIIVFPIYGSYTYPANELQAFPVREGAFYGSLFGDGGVVSAAITSIDANNPLLPDGGLNYDHTSVWSTSSVSSTVAPGYVQVFPQMYSCYDERWTNGQAYLTDRVCALPYAGGPHLCAATSVGNCGTYTNHPRSCVYENTLDGGMDGGLGDFDSCYGGGTSWGNPITTYLNQPCDVLGDAGTACSYGDPPPPILY